MVVQGSEVKSAEKLKVLGFQLQQDGGVAAQVNKLAAAVRARSWQLRVLRRSGLCEKDLVSVYQTHVRPKAEYSAVVIHSQMTAEQSECLERQQTHALRQVFGYGISASKMRERAGVERLAVRRERLCRGFATKAQANPRFSHRWFPKRSKPENTPDLRAGKRLYQEMKARTDRRYNSPLFYFRRLLNE